MSKILTASDTETKHQTQVTTYYTVNDKKKPKNHKTKTFLEHSQTGITKYCPLYYVTYVIKLWFMSHMLLLSTTGAVHGRECYLIPLLQRE
jgi:hypothetical protein